ncbi:hypothetical protein V2J09_017701 [Rumex salicifolius]
MSAGAKIPKFESEALVLKTKALRGHIAFTSDKMEARHLLYRRYEYRWADGVNIKKPIEVSAPKYVEYLMDWIEAQLDDESIFPQKLGM